MNIFIEYMYRDGANYKQFSEVIISNKKKIPITEIKKKISLYLIGGEYFIPRHWKLPALHYFLWDEEIDHHFHELIEINESLSDSNFDLDIADIIKL